MHLKKSLYDILFNTKKTMKATITISTFLLFISFLQFTQAALNKEKVVAAIKCGSRTSYKSPNSDVEFSEDKYFRGGIESSAGEQYTEAWPEIPDLALYQTERYTNSESLVYEIPLPKGSEDGHYVLVLKFSEVYFTAPGKKVFDISLGSHTVLKDVDIFAKVGKFAPYDEFIEFDVKKNTVFFQGRALESAVSTKGGLVVKFIRGKSDNPKVNAIILVKGTLDDTDHATYVEEYRNAEKLMRLKAEKQVEKRKKDIESMLEADEDLDLSTLGQKWERGKAQLVKDMDPIKAMVNNFLAVPYGLEGASIAFVAIFFFLFSFVWIFES